MNRLLFLINILLICVCTSCKNDETVAPQEQTIPVTYTTLHGKWQLIELDGKPLAEGLYLYMTLDRKEQTFEIVSNYKSPYAQTQTGKFELSGDDYHGWEVSGTYGVIAGDWAHTYRVDYIYASGTMRWIATDDATATQVFRKQNP